jgi:hypothetical protein
MAPNIKRSVFSSTVLNAFVVDSYILPAHWCYLTNVIEEKLVPLGLLQQTPGKLLAPGLVNDYHKPKTAGELTHYGDQSLWLLEHLTRAKSENFRDPSPNIRYGMSHFNLLKN